MQALQFVRAIAGAKRGAEHPAFRNGAQDDDAIRAEQLSQARHDRRHQRIRINDQRQRAIKLKDRLTIFAPATARRFFLLRFEERALHILVSNSV